MNTSAHLKLQTPFSIILSVSNACVHIFSELCGEIDANIEQSTGLLYEDDMNQALVHMQMALKKLNVSLNKKFIDVGGKSFI